MGWKELMSDQYVNWSDRDARRVCKRSSTPTQNFVEATAFAAGTVAGIERYKPCGKPGCKCARGPGHGPKHYLSVSRSRARPRMDYVPQASTPQVRPGQLPPRARAPQEDEVCDNRELLRRREKLRSRSWSRTSPSQGSDPSHDREGHWL